MADELKKSQLHAIQYFYVDGTFEFSFGGLCLVLAIYFFVQEAAPESLLSAILNMGFIAAVIAWIGYRSALPRFYLVALAVFLIGISLAVSGLGDMLGLALVYGLTSLILFTSGGLTLWKYLHQNPVLQESPDEH